MLLHWSYQGPLSGRSSSCGVLQGEEREGREEKDSIEVNSYWPRCCLQTVCELIPPGLRLPRLHCECLFLISTRLWDGFCYTLSPLSRYCLENQVQQEGHFAHSDLKNFWSDSTPQILHLGRYCFTIYSKVRNLKLDVLIRGTSYLTSVMLCLVDTLSQQFLTCGLGITEGPRCLLRGEGGAMTGWKIK